MEPSPSPSSFVVIPLTSSEEEEEEQEDGSDGLCVVQALKTTGFMDMLYEAYLSEDPHGVLRARLDNFPSIKVNWSRIQDLLSLVRWNVSASKDDSHPMAFVVEDIHKLRAKQRDASKEEDQEVIMWTFCFYATSVPQVWCDEIVPGRDRSKPSRARLSPSMRPCAYRLPNMPVPWVWFNANGHASIRMMGHNMTAYKRRVLRVALYRRFKEGAVNTIKPEFTFDKYTDAQPHSRSLLHLLVDTSAYEDGTGPIAITVIKPVKGWTFMLFLSEGAHNTYVSTTLNDGDGEGTLLKYPVVIHELQKPPPVPPDERDSP